MPGELVKMPSAGSTESAPEGGPRIYIFKGPTSSLAQMIVGLGREWPFVLAGMGTHPQTPIRAIDN